jgi:hypothetical protein
MPSTSYYENYTDHINYTPNDDECGVNVGGDLSDKDDDKMTYTNDLYLMTPARDHALYCTERLHELKCALVVLVTCEVVVGQVIVVASRVSARDLHGDADVLLLRVREVLQPRHAAEVVVIGAQEDLQTPYSLNQPTSTHTTLPTATLLCARFTIVILFLYL